MLDYTESKLVALRRNCLCQSPPRKRALTFSRDLRFHSMDGFHDTGLSSDLSLKAILHPKSNICVFFTLFYRQVLVEVLQL